MFEYFVTIYNHNCSSDEQWKETQQLVSQELIWETLLAKLKSLNKNRYYFALLDFETLTMGKLIKAIHSFVAQDDFYKELYGKNNSDKHTDLINIAKLIALYKGERNYHHFLLPGAVQDYDLLANNLYTMKHADLCAVRRTPLQIPAQVAGGEVEEVALVGGPGAGGNPAASSVQFDLLTFDDILANFKETGRLENFYARQNINPAQTIAHPECSHRAVYLAYVNTMNGKLSKSAFAALKDYAELVSNQFDAENRIDSFFYRRRVDTKKRAFANLCAFVESLPREERDALYAMKINSRSTFKDRLDGAKRGDCLSQFADDITKILYQCDNTIRFTNPRPNQVIARQRDSLVLKGEVLNTDEEDRRYLRNMQKVIINTHYNVKRGTQVTLDGKTNWVPGSVAGIFHKCGDGIAGRGITPGEARYQTVKTASEASLYPHHNSILLFLLLLIVTIRDRTTDNFYALVFNEQCSKIIEENDSLDHHDAFTRGVHFLQP
ncbi:Uncharacterised protein [Legionella donaldsonii]|uniref:Uncharacterized protein n=1 Tax=Legionella donaldsonii TaxID=45060 RepID=A0A378J0W8_9GAMM|nr:hypothetical protein [Legionella donaldsonii]STX41382.1 Uncharacterised protein [Legionella donaldsonii]